MPSSNLFFAEPLPSDMTMWMDKINDHIDYNSMPINGWFLLL